ncbi:MAG: Verru Chthon cassette protein, partial [Verrucomicrobiaceae bacterium]|nr:Verru Chthon cassette protein [Verrucomicrobiaceae bacterium]
DTPLTRAAMVASTRYRDFDNGPGNLRDGPYINKPDDGNLSVMKFWHGHGIDDKSGVQAGYYAIRNTYFTSSFLQLPATSAYFTPNRMVSSPGMFGSLPTGVWGSRKEKAAQDQREHSDTDGIPWRTLLFRADVDGHVGAASWNNSGEAGGGVDPADHYFMDLFFMPIVEPYAITDSYSTAGKINLNFQIVPFTYIRRATAVYAAMKGEMITAYSSVDTDPRKAAAAVPSDTNTVIYKKIKDVNPIPPELWNETTDKVYWHREIDVEETVQQLDERFAFRSASTAVGSVGLMLAPSQVCELHLIPRIPAGTARPGKANIPAEPSAMKGMDEHNRRSTMAAYWKHNDLTGDNTRERPYANLYQKFTTRSNTFRVYFTAQTLRKARSLLPNQVDTRRDTVTSEYRGSALLERYLDFSTAGTAALSNNDYGNGDSLVGKKSLESFYHYRVIEMKQFAP